MKKKHQKIKTIVKYVIIILLIGVVAGLSYIPHMMMSDAINMHVDFSDVHTADEVGLESKTHYLETDDDLTIVAYEVEVIKPKAVVIMISGIHNPSVTSFFGHAKMLEESGYASILFETRAHGESEGDVIGLGYTEVLDTKAVVDYIKTVEAYKDVPIVVWGISMGGTIAINATGELDDIDALISMSAFSSFEDIFYDNIMMMGAPKAYALVQSPFAKLYTVFKYGISNAEMTAKNQIKNIGTRPALIVHSKEDSQVPFGSYERIMKNAPEHVESWIVPGDNHMILKGDFMKPWEDELYYTTIMTFLDKL